MSQLGDNRKRDLAQSFTRAWQRAVESIIEAGQILIDAKRDLPHGLWRGWVDDYLPVSLSTAEALMRIARHPVISKSEFIQNLPPSWGTLYEITKLPDDEIEKLIADGSINCETTRAQVVEMIDAWAAANHSELLLYVHGYDALGLLQRFMRRWPDAADVALDVLETEDGDAREYVDADALPEVAAWVKALHAAYVEEEARRAQEDAKAEEEARRAKKEAEAEKEEEVKPKRKRVRLK